MTTSSRMNNGNVQLFKNQFDNLFDDFLSGSFLGFPYINSVPAQGKPKINISEDEKNYNIEAELPGITKEDIEINYADEVLTISAQRQNKKEDKAANYHRVESYYGTLRRSIHIPNVNKDGIEASFKDGVLVITLPKAKAALPEARKITIK